MAPTPVGESPGESHVEKPMEGRAWGGYSPRDAEIRTRLSGFTTRYLRLLFSGFIVLFTVFKPSGIYVCFQCGKHDLLFECTIYSQENHSQHRPASERQRIHRAPRPR